MIQIENLSKTYGKFSALKGISFEVKKGSVFGFVGPNGAGKSTTMQILSTLMASSGGRVYIGGYDVIKQPKAVRQLIGYMPDFFGVYDHLTTEEYLNFYGAAYGISNAERKKTIPQLLELVSLSHKKDQLVDSLSRGMKQRLGLARCLVHNPEVLILDEPASGLDPRARIEMREILKELRNMGKTILISSHILPELAELSDVIGVIEEGEMVAIGSVEEINRRMKGKKLLKIRLTERWREAMVILKEKPFITSVEEDGDWIIAGFNGEDKDQSALLNEMILGGYPVLSYSETEGNLEEIFLEITKGAGS